MGRRDAQTVVVVGPNAEFYLEIRTHGWLGIPFPGPAGAELEVLRRT